MYDSIERLQVSTSIDDMYSTLVFEYLVSFKKGWERGAAMSAPGSP